jgi:hypothetical protein
VNGAKAGDIAVLLVDSEEAVVAESPWDHVKNRELDGWQRPGGASDEHLHLMVQCMEAWIVADRSAMRTFFGNGYADQRLPPTGRSIESVSKADLGRAFKSATKGTQRGPYGKGEHSFKLLAELDPSLIRAASPWAERFFSTLPHLLAGEVHERRALRLIPWDLPLPIRHGGGVKEDCTGMKTPALGRVLRMAVARTVAARIDLVSARR